MSARIYDAQLSREQFRLKLASKALVKAVHGTETAGEICGLRQQRVSEATLPNCPSFFSIEDVRALEEVARGAPGWPHVTRALAREHGFALLALPEAGAGEGNWHEAVSVVAKETGEAVSRVCAALSDDGKVSGGEIREQHIVEEIEEAIEGLVKLKGLCLAALDEDKR